MFLPGAVKCADHWLHMFRFTGEAHALFILEGWFASGSLAPLVKMPGRTSVKVCWSSRPLIKSGDAALLTVPNLLVSPKSVLQYAGRACKPAFVSVGAATSVEELKTGWHKVIKSVMITLLKPDPEEESHHNGVVEARTPCFSHFINPPMSISHIYAETCAFLQALLYKKKPHQQSDLLGGREKAAGKEKKRHSKHAQFLFRLFFLALCFVPMCTHSNTGWFIIYLF